MGVSRFASNSGSVCSRGLSRSLPCVVVVVLHELRCMMCMCGREGVVEVGLEVGSFVGGRGWVVEVSGGQSQRSALG